MQLQTEKEKLYKNMDTEKDKLIYLQTQTKLFVDRQMERKQIKRDKNDKNKLRIEGGMLNKEDV